MSLLTTAARFVDLRCPTSTCNKLLFRIRPDSARAFVSIKCPRCRSLHMLAVGSTGGHPWG